MSLGFGACLADDMGLGKTIQFLYGRAHDVWLIAAGHGTLVCGGLVVGRAG